MTSRRSQLQEDTYLRVLRMLQHNPDMTQREIAEKLSISTSGLNCCLKMLIDKGWIKVQNFSQSKNKFGYIYMITLKGLVEKIALTSKFLKRKMQEYDALKVEIEVLNLEAGNADSQGVQKHDSNYPCNLSTMATPQSGSRYCHAPFTLSG